MENEEDDVERLKRELEAASALRAAGSASPIAIAARARLRAWQAARLIRTHADLLASPRFSRAAHFFVSDLYGPDVDFGKLDAEIHRALPLMSRFLPGSGLATVADAVSLDALSESLDFDMVRALGEAPIDGPAYGAAYRAIGRAEDRARQIGLIEHCGASLDRLARKPFIGTTLALMHTPAILAGLSALQDFLERGYQALHKVDGVDEFLAIVIGREKAISAALFAGDDSVLEGLGG